MFYFSSPKKLILSLLAVVASVSARADLPGSATFGTEYAQTQNANPREVMFIHGMFMVPKCWDEWIERFQKAGYIVSAPAWPLHTGTVTELRQPNTFEALSKLKLDEVLDHYRALLKAKTVKPVLIGHSMGGLIAQILLSEGLAQAAVAIDSAPPKGVFVLSWSFLKSNWGAINPLASSDKPIELDLEQFSYAFLNQQDPARHQSIYEEFYVPESRRIGKAPTQKVARIDTDRARGPLLIVAGGADHIIPAKLNYKNFKMYRKTPAYTEFMLFEGRDHWILAGTGWEQVALAVEQWINARFKH